MNNTTLRPRPTRTGAEDLHQALLKEQVEILFTVPGASIIDFLDCLYNSTIKTVLTRHEQGAVHMADGYARSTGKTGVVLATSGPGATNLVTGLATAFADSVPLVALAGQVKRPLLGTDAFQEADMPRIAAPVTKHVWRVMSASGLAGCVAEAFALASAGRAGPVLLDIPADVFSDTVEAEMPAPAAQSKRQDARQG